MLGWRYDWPLTPPNGAHGDCELLRRASVLPKSEDRSLPGRSPSGTTWTTSSRSPTTGTVSVRQAPTSHFAGASQSREVAALTWERSASGELAGTGGGEALRTYAAHAPEAESRSACAASRRVTCGRASRSRGPPPSADSDVAAMLALPDRVPLVTWLVHGELLARCTSTGL